MDSQRWYQIREIFAVLSDETALIRREYLDQHLSGEEELRREVEEMLAAHDGLSSAPFDLPHIAPTEIPSSFGSYEIFDAIGMGGIGKVFLARHPDLGEVALKVLSHQFIDNPETVKRFQREASILEQLSHQHIVPVYKVDRLENTDGFCIVMQYARDGTLRSRKEALTLDEGLEIVISVASGLQHAHDKGFLHRDVKPENILFDDGLPMLADFGIARPTLALSTITQTNAFIGTPEYMSPEQVVGKELDERSDLYSLGIVLYELLTGNVPYVGGSAVAMGILQVTTVPPPLQNALSFLQPFIDRLLAKSPEGRPQSAAALVQTLSDIRSDLPLSSDTPLRDLWQFAPPQVDLDRRTDPEKRQLTIVCCKLENYEDLLLTLDMEDLQEIVQTFQNTVEQVARRYLGYVAQHLRDRSLIYFGFPVAQEDDAMRSIHFSLQIREDLESLSFSGDRNAYESSIGIHTGPVIIGGSTEQARIAVGGTPDVANRLQALAKTGAILISESTSRLLGGQFELEQSGNSGEISGGFKSGDYFQVVAPAQHQSRFSGMHMDEPTRLFGREDELEWLLQHWSATTGGALNAVAIVGEAGIGKSSLITALHDKLNDKAHYSVVYQCSPYHNDTAFYPISSQLVREVELNRGASAEQTMEDLRRHLGASREEIGACIGLLGVDIEIESDSVDINVSAKERRRQTMNLLQRFHVNISETGPVFIVLEDAHWADATTLEYFQSLVTGNPERPILVVVTARPESEPGLLRNEAFSRRELTNLSASAILDIVEHTSAQSRLSADVKSQVVVKADGVPLFAEELTKEMIVVDDQRRAGVLDQTRAAEDSVPSTLHDALISRLDRMSSAKAVAQTAACIGREFDRGLLGEVVSMQESELDLELERLIAAKVFLPAIGIRPDHPDQLAFKHALLRDAAYGSLLRSRRKAIHKDIFKALESIDARPELLAHHATEAGDVEQAIALWETAGIAAEQRAAFNEAISHFEKALQLSNSQETTAQNRIRELGFLVKQTHCSTAVNGFAHPITVRANILARKLLDRVDKTPFRFPILYGHWVISFAQGKHRDALTDARGIQKEADEMDNRVYQLLGHRVIAATLTMMGEFERALSEFKEFLERYDSPRDGNLAWQYGTDPAASARVYGGLAHICSGNTALATQIIEPLEQYSETLNHPHTIIYTMAHLALTSQVGRLPERERYIKKANAIADQQDLAAYKGHTRGIQAMCLYDLGKSEEAEQAMAESLSIIEITKTHIYTPVMLGYYSAILAANGQPEASEAAQIKAFSVVEQNEETWSVAEVHRVIAESRHTHFDDFDDAIVHISHAIQISREQKAYLWELRARLAGARIYDSEHMRSKALQLLDFDRTLLAAVSSSNQELLDAERFREQLQSP